MSNVAKIDTFSAHPCQLSLLSVLGEQTEYLPAWLGLRRARSPVLGHAHLGGRCSHMARDAPYSVALRWVSHVHTPFNCCNYYISCLVIM